MHLATERRFGTMVSNAPPDMTVVPLDRVAGRTRLVSSDADVVAAARTIGIVFGDEAAARFAWTGLSGEHRTA
jgi:hypothetical protein